ncbi:hypothetical protein [Nocardia sp. NPDC058666]|uniref:hypothetical protein n=1 Tax=unclassified Nocardia TaxID=2637762 RepID=UPI0036683E88
MGGDSSGIGGVLPIILDIGPVPTDAGQQIVEQLGATQQRVKAATEALVGKGAGTDSDYAVTDERFEGMPAQQLYNSVHGPGGMEVAGLETIRGVWNSATSDLGTVSIGMQTRVLALLNDGALTGQAGDAAAAAATRLGQVANQISQVFSAVTGRAEQLYYTAEAVRTAVQQLPTPMLTVDPNNPAQSLIPGIPNPATVTTDREAEKQVKAANVAAMNSIYKPGYPPAGSGVPAYSFVPAALTGDGGAQGNSSGPGSAGAPGGTGGTDGSWNNSPENGSPATPGGEDGTPTDTGEQADAGDSSSAVSGQSSAGSDGATSEEPAQTAPAGTAPATLSPSSAPQGSPGATSLGSGSAGMGSGVGGSLGVGAPAAPVPGQPAPGNVASTAAAGGGSAARPAGSPMMGPMGGAGAGQRRGEPDEEHTSPGYLRGVKPDWLEGITAYDSVLGGETIAAEANSAQGYTSEPAPTAAVSMPVSHQPVSVSPEPAPNNPAPTLVGNVERPARDREDTPASPSTTTETSQGTGSTATVEPAMSAEVAALLSQYDWGPTETDTGTAAGVAEPEPGTR